MNPKYYHIFLFIFMALASCTKEVDFNQIDDANVHSVYTSTLVYADFSAIKFLDDYNQEISYTTDFIEAPIDKTTIKYLEKVEFTLIINNTFNREFNFTFHLSNDAQNIIYTFNDKVVNVPPNSEKSNSLLIPIDDIHFLKDTRFFEITVELKPSTDGSTLNGTETGNLNLKSSAKLFYNFRKI